MDSHQMSGSGSVYLVLEETLPVIHTALVSFYGFSDLEAETFQDMLAVWFQRVARRASGPVALVNLREQLAFIACKYARDLQLAKLENAPRNEGNLANVLQASPEEVAFALLNNLPSVEGSL